MSTPPPVITTSSTPQTITSVSTPQPLSQSHHTHVPSAGGGIMSAVGGKPTTPASTPPANIKPVAEKKQPESGKLDPKVEVKQEPMETNNSETSDVGGGKKEPREFSEESNGKSEPQGAIATKEEPGGSSTPMEESKPQIDQKPTLDKAETSSSSTSSTPAVSSNSTPTTATAAAATTATDNKAGTPRNKRGMFCPFYDLFAVWNSVCI